MTKYAKIAANGTRRAFNGTNGTKGRPTHNAWASPGPSAFDLRSDVVTTPTSSMLEAIAQTTLLDDVFVEDPTTNSLESFVAELTGKPAALLVLSGSMGNQVAIRAHLGAPPHAILCDQRCHIIQYEAGGVASLSGALVQTVIPANKKYITLEEVEANAVIEDGNVHSCPTKIVEVENTLNGTIMPLAELRRISKWAHERKILVHMDGARLWEAVAAGAGSLKEFCAEVDSVSLCFSKGLGAPIGSIIVGSEAFIKRARWVRKSVGGALRQAGVVAAPARVAVEETFLGGKLEQSHVTAKRVAKVWQDLGGKMLYPVDTNMVWLDFAAHGLEEDKFVTLAEKYGLKTNGARLVIHYQIREEAVGKLEQVFAEVLKGKKGSSRKRKADVSAEELKLKHVE